MSNIDYGFLANQYPTFDFGERKKPDMVLGDPQPYFWDSRLGKMTRWDSLQHKAEHFYTDPYYQYHQPATIQFDKRSNLPKKRYVRAKNAGTIEPPPLSFRNPNFRLREVKRPTFAEPKETQSFETGINAPEHSQKFVFSQPPMQDLQRQFYEGHLHELNSSEKRRDRDGLLEYLRSSGRLDQSDLQKPISALISKIYEISESNEPFLGNPLMQEIEARNVPSNQPKTSTQEQRNQQAIQGMSQLNQQQSAGITGSGGQSSRQQQSGISRSGQQALDSLVQQELSGGGDQSGAVQAGQILPQSSQKQAGASASASASAEAGSEPGFSGTSRPIPRGERVPVNLRSGKTMYVASEGGIYPTATSNNTKRNLSDAEKREALVKAGFDNKSIISILGEKQT